MRSSAFLQEFIELTDIPMSCCRLHSDCKCLIQIDNINKTINYLQSMIDLTGKMFWYYRVYDKFVNESNVTKLNFVDEDYGFIRIFCEDCLDCFDTDYSQCIHGCCKNVDEEIYVDGNGNKYCICYNHIKEYEASAMTCFNEDLRTN